MLLTIGLLWIMVYIDVTISELENSNPAHCHLPLDTKREICQRSIFLGALCKIVIWGPAAVYTGSQKVRYRAVTVPSSSGRCHSSPDMEAMSNNCWRVQYAEKASFLCWKRLLRGYHNHTLQERFQEPRTLSVSVGKYFSYKVIIYM